MYVKGKRKGKKKKKRNKIEIVSENKPMGLLFIII